jgi:hypothetical protein
MKNFKNSGISRGGLMYAGVVRQGKTEIRVALFGIAPPHVRRTNLGV